MAQEFKVGMAGGRAFWRVAALCGGVVCACPPAVVAAPDKAAIGLDAAMGKALFKRNWVPAPSSTKANDGLGPLFNARSCAQCHSAATAGRLEVTAQGALAERGGVVRLSAPQGSGDPTYGAQLQTNAVAGQTAEGRVKVEWVYSQATLADGTQIELRRPALRLTELGYGAIDQNVTSSLLLAPSLAVSAQIDRSARSAAVAVFGHKATESSLENAVAIAFSRDLGLATTARLGAAGDCTSRQTACMTAPHGDDGSGLEIAPEIVASIAAYVRSLRPPSAPHEARTREAGRLFADAGCAACHRRSLPGKGGTPVVLFSDLELHDMGEGLAGVVGEQGQKSSEWRTAPLIGMSERLAAGSTLLHDGRARSIAEAILWHDGAAKASRQTYERLTSRERDTLHAYIMGR